MKRIYFPICILLSAMMISLLSSCCDDCEFPLENYSNFKGVNVFEHKVLNELFTRYGGGWTGGNGGYPIPLPDGRTLWLFGTSFLDTVYSDRTRPANAKYIRNCFVITDGSSFETLYKGTPDDPRPMIEHDYPDYFYEPVGGQLIGDTLEVACAVYYQYEGFKKITYNYGIDIVRLLLPTFEYVDKKSIPLSPGIQFGFDYYHEAGYTYILGGEDYIRGRHAVLARVPEGSLMQPWEFLYSNGWDDSFHSIAIHSNIFGYYSFFKDGDNYTLLTTDDQNLGKIRIYQNPDFNEIQSDPSYSSTMLYQVPNDGEVIIHSARVLKHLSTADELVVEYNCTPESSAGGSLNADNFRVFFLRIRNWK